MKKYYITILILTIISGCVILEEPLEYAVGSIIYQRQVSKKEIVSEDYPNRPKSSINSVIVRKDSTLQIKFTTKKGRKKHKGAYYYYIENSIDTIRTSVKDSSFVKTHFFISGNFLPPKMQIPFVNYSDRGVAFHDDGSCIHTWISHCTDSPCSTTHQYKGEYLYRDNIIEVTYFLSRNFNNNLIPLKHNPIKSINEVEWKVMQPTSSFYGLSENNDTLKALDSNGNDKIGRTWIIENTLKRTIN